MSIKICDNKSIQKFNKKYLFHNYPTDVLAFSVGTSLPEESKDFFYIGDCLISLEMAFERSKEFDWTVDEELSLYIIHGVLHLLGYRDKSSKDSEIMDQKQKIYMDMLKKNILEEKLIDHE